MDSPINGDTPLDPTPRQETATPRLSLQPTAPQSDVQSGIVVMRELQYLCTIICQFGWGRINVSLSTRQNARSRMWIAGVGAVAPDTVRDTIQFNDMCREKRPVKRAVDAEQ